MRFIFILFLFISIICSANDNSVQIKAIKVGQDVLVSAVNTNPFSVTVSYSAEFKNLSMEKKIPMFFVLKPQSETEVLKLHIEKPGFEFKAHYQWTVGSKDAKHDDSYVYRLPYKRGRKEMVSQGFNGKFSHFGESRYAVDFNLKEGTGVYAAREGRVIIVKEDSNRGGASKEYENDANYVLIEHSDGTIASYAHLKKNGVLVQAGQVVQKGQQLGYSGKTGYARGAHLHFMVYKAIDGSHRQSLPITFMSKKGLIQRPVKGMFYQAK